MLCSYILFAHINIRNIANDGVAQLRLGDGYISVTIFEGEIIYFILYELMVSVSIVFYLCIFQGNLLKYMSVYKM